MPTPISRDRWSLSYDLVEGGLVLSDVKHDMFSVADDIRVPRVWVDTGDPLTSGGANQRSFKLNGPDLPAVGPVAVLDATTPTRPTNPSSFFAGYNNLFGLTASYKSKTPYLGGTPNACDLDLKQTYLFANYGKSPAHEPGAVLDATRLFPLLRFYFPAVKDPSKPYPKYFRADYRLDIDLDNIDESVLKAALTTGALAKGDVTTNKAAIFRDFEALPGVLGLIVGAVRFVGSIITSGPGVDELFAALEKPMPYEIASWGLVGGRMPPSVSKLDTWDNLHIWPAKRSAGTSPISTPGAFHAFHCHWRWGAVSGDPNLGAIDRRLLPAGGAPQFTGVGWSRAVGGPLIDTAIPLQNLQFAITKNDVSDWAKAKNPSEKEWRSLFTSKRSIPDDIRAGDNLIFWLCFEAFRDETKLSDPWGGTLFVNGFYFAHNQDATPAAARAGGAHGEATRPAPARKWERLAR